LGALILGIASWFADVPSSILASDQSAARSDGNRLTYLDELNPYYVSRQFPRLVTPQWVGEDGVEAVVVLAIDDMRDPPKYEAYLRPILQRLKQIDGRAPVSIMTCNVRPDDPQQQSWLAEGLSIEIHTVDHPCPLLKDGDFAKAKRTYDDCIDRISKITGNRPVAYRMPCCDSLNTVSPRAFAEIFNKTTPQGHYLEIDTSVFNVPTWRDPTLPQALTLDEQGLERFRKYLPADRTFVNTIENYPYPYVIGGLCWEFPCAVPSDWSAQHRQQPNNPSTVRDWKAYLDLCVIKQGVFNLVFHPHGWIQAEQVVELIDHAQAAHGRKVKFLTFREAAERLNRFLLADQPLRAADGGDNGVRVLDLNNDGYQDVVIGNDQLQRTRVWSAEKREWMESSFPVELVAADSAGEVRATAARFGVIDKAGSPAVLVASAEQRGAWRFDGRDWLKDDSLLRGLEIDGKPVLTVENGRDRGFRFRDLDGDGVCEIIAAAAGGIAQRIFRFDFPARIWKPLPFTLPNGASLVDSQGADAGVRFVDVDEDGRDDVVVSNEAGYSVSLFASPADGWSIPALSGKRPEQKEIPPFVREGTNNGAWFHSRHLWVQNEDTATLKDLVARVSFDAMLADVTPRPLSAERSQALIEAPPGFVVELVAAEPLVKDPVAFEWGADGKLWVAEMADYPLGLDNNGQPGGRVRFLEDTDNDGRYDRSTLFLKGLRFPNGVMPWRRGVLISAAPEILYAEDTDGDGQSDHTEALFRGFIEGNQQHRVNGFTYGLDNRLYCANGDSDGDILSIPAGAQVNIAGHDFSFDPDTGEIELEAGETQFGRNRDDWGNWFGSSNSNPMYHYVLPERSLRRNASLAVPSNRHDVSETPGASPVYPVSRPLARFNDFDRLNRFTSACSAIVYRDELFGPEFAESAFVSEPVHNLVHREVMSPRGVSFTSRRVPGQEHAEFLASRDNWFRPTMIKTGPDGALWIADMYRLLIEHPQYIPKEQWPQLPMRDGDDRGRLYRVYPAATGPRPIARLDGLSTAELVAALDSPSGWQRDTAQRLLVHANDPAAVPLLIDLARDAARPAARLHALCTLDGLQALTTAAVLVALEDPDARVRRHAVRLAEGLLTSDVHVGPAVAARQDDADAQVRLQVALTLGAWNDPRAEEALARLLLRHGSDPWFSTAILSSLNERNMVAVLRTFLADANYLQQHPELAGRLFSMAASTASGNETLLAEALDLLFTTGEEGRFHTWQFAALAEALDARDRRRRRFWRRDAGNGGPDLSKQQERMEAMLAAARPVALNEQASETDRIAAIRLVGRSESSVDGDLELLEGLLSPRAAAAFQSAAVQRLGAMREERAADVLIDGWSSYAPDLRGQVLDALLSRFDGAEILLDALEQGTIAPAHLSAERRERLLRTRSRRVRGRAEKVFAGATDPNRQKVVEDYRAALKLAGNAARGQQLFAKTCTACHKVGDTGFAVGPDLASLKDRGGESLLVSLFDPNRAVESKFLNYAAVTVSGRTYTGILVGESGGSVSLLGAEGKTSVLLREEVDELHCTERSAMPEGLERDLSPQDTADLIEYLQQVGKSP